MNSLQVRYKLPPVLQPRLTWRYCLSSLAIAYVAYCFLFNTPFFSSKLSRYTGPYGVGAIDIEVPVREPRLIHDAVFRETGEPAFKLDTVLFTLYYPAKQGVKSKKAHHYWVPKPLHLTAVGYAKFAHVSNALTNNLFTSVIGILVGSTRIPAEVDVPLVSESETLETSKSKSKTQKTRVQRSPADQEPITGDPSASGGLPIIVFSHGMASSRTQYSQYLSELASHGYVCAAIEHRDGSGPGTQVISTLDGAPAHPINRLHFDLDDIKPKSSSSAAAAASLPNEPITIEAFKRIQLAYREAEILETTHVIHSLSVSPSAGAKILRANSRHEGSGAGLATNLWTSRLNTNLTILAGHSYGATGALQALKPATLKDKDNDNNSTSTSTSTRNLFAGGIILDPGKSSGPLNADVAVPLLIVHSTSWSAKRSIFYNGRPHFDTVRDIAATLNARGVPAWFMTSLGTAHPSVTDAPLIEPLLLKWSTGASVEGVAGVRQYVDVSGDFAWFVGTGERRGLLACPAASEAYSPDNGRTEKRWRAFWQVHVSPVRSGSLSGEMKVR